jgi:hypothetical protein
MRVVEVSRLGLISRWKMSDSDSERATENTSRSAMRGSVVVVEDKQVTKVQDRATCALKEAVSTMAK